MSIPISIGGTTINFPESGASPNWAPAVIQFAQAVSSALSGISGEFDVSPQIYTMVANSNTDVDLPNLAFPTTDVRGAFIQYSVYRTTTLSNASESGNIIVTYNVNGTTNNKWEIVRDFDGDASVTFTITDVGQVQFSSTALSGSSHSGTITYTAKALLQS